MKAVKHHRDINSEFLLPNGGAEYQISSGCKCKSKYFYHIRYTLPSIFFLQNIAGGNFSIDSSYIYFKKFKFRSVIIFGNLIT